MIEPIIHAFKEFFEALAKVYFGEYKKLQSVNSFRGFSIDILKVIRGFIILIYIFIIGDQLVVIYDNIRWSKVLEFEPVILITFIVTLPAYYFCNVGIKKINESINLEKFFFENQKLQIDKIYTQTLSIGNKISKNYQISFSFFSSVVNAQNDYVRFIELLQKTTNIQPQKLTNIAKIAMKSTCGHFMCVIAYLDFFKDDNEFREMINYFSKYEEVASLKKNFVQRIFTIPGTHKDDPNEGCYKTIWINEENKINNYYLLCYLVLNYICSCETYLLIYDESKKEVLSDCFLVDVDYVLAFKNQDDVKEDNVELYFAYPEVGDLNRTLKINDEYFIRMFELDFRKRMELEPSDETPTTLFEFNKSNFNYILQMLHINREITDDKNLLNEKLDLVKTLLGRNQLFNQTIVSQIDEWRI